MIDCSITENYLKERARATAMCGTTCCDCPLSNKKTQTLDGCIVFQADHPKKAIAVVQKWSDEHPQRTYLSDFLEKYPNAPIQEDVTPATCPRELGYALHSPCDCSVCIDCWNTPMHEVTP